MLTWMWVGLALAQTVTEEPAPLAVPAADSEPAAPAAEEPEEAGPAPTAEPEATDPASVFAAPVEHHRWRVEPRRRGYAVYDDEDREVEIRRFATVMGHERVKRQATEMARRRATGASAGLTLGSIGLVAGLPLYAILSEYRDTGGMVLSGATVVVGAAAFTAGTITLGRKRVRRPWGWYSEAEAVRLVARYNGGQTPSVPEDTVPAAAPEDPPPAERLFVSEPWELERTQRGTFVVDGRGSRVPTSELALVLAEPGVLDALTEARNQRRLTGLGAAGVGVGVAVLGLAGGELWSDLDAPALGTGLAVAGVAGALAGTVWAFTASPERPWTYFTEDQLQRAVDKHNAASGVSKVRRSRQSSPQVQLTLGLTSVGVIGRF